MLYWTQSVQNYDWGKPFSCIGNVTGKNSPHSFPKIHNKEESLNANSEKHIYFLMPMFIWAF